ncbi:MAG: hypothetical protein EOO65_05065 [Methanosarcinales archaeon]|nr:MAG: hypothetical protein EOO65_05065 [Methanosarcinales archaeon]
MCAEIETIYFIFLSFVPLIPADKAAAVMEQMAATVAASTERSMLRLKLLANFFNSESNKHTKLNLFFKIVQYAGESKHMDLLAPYLTQASQWPTTWGISSAEARKLYLLISQTLSKTADAYVLLFMSCVCVCALHLESTYGCGVCFVA